MKLTAWQDKYKNPVVPLRLALYGRVGFRPVPVLELDVQLQPWHHHHPHQHHHRHHHYHHQRLKLQYVSRQPYERSDDAIAVFRTATRTHHTEDASGADPPKCSDLLYSSTPLLQGCASLLATLYAAWSTVQQICLYS